VRAQAVVDGGNGQDRLGMLSGPVCLFLFSFPFPGGGGGGDVVALARTTTPYRTAAIPSRVLTVECTCARACNRRCAWEFFLRLSRHV